jgi:hypothetical protein
MSILDIGTTTDPLVTDEFISDWYFNFTLDVDELTFTAVDIADVQESPPPSGNFDPNTDIIYGSNCTSQTCTADGDGMYDIVFMFPTTNAASGAKRFTNGESVSFDIAYGGTGTFDLSTFIDLSGPVGGQGIYNTAAHVLSITTDASGNDLTQCADGTVIIDEFGNRVPDPSGGYKTCSGWIANGGAGVIVPEPVSSTLFLVGAGALGARRFWKKRKVA